MVLTVRITTHKKNMGQITFIFLSGGKEIFKETSLSEIIAKVQYLQRKHCVSKIQELRIDEDIEIKIDIEEIKDEIKWEQFEQLSPKIIENIRGIEYFHNIKESLKSIISNLGYCRYVDRFKIQALGEQAIRIIESTKESIFNKSFYSYNTPLIENLKYTVEQKEVPFLIEYVKPKDSNKKQKQAVDQAVRQLIFDIEILINKLSDY